MRNRMGYNSYHGRTSRKKIALAVVLAVLLAGSAAYLFLQDRIVYRSDGSIALDLPFFRGEEDAPPEEGETLPVEILPEEDDGALSPLHAREAAAADLTAEAIGALRSEGYDGVVVEMKGFNGMYAYASAYATNQALEADAVSPAAVREALEGRGDFTAVARVDCFHDSFHAFSDMAGAGICQPNGYIWYDELRSHWLDPAKEGTAAYLGDVLRECVEMGFDEILLAGFTYPTGGNQDQIDESVRSADKTAALADCFAALRQAVGEDVTLSLELSQEQLLAGRDDVSGLDPAVLLPLADRVYVTGLTDRAAAEAVLASCGAGAGLVEVAGQAGEQTYTE